MIPTDVQIIALWDKYRLPQEKRIHVQLVDRVAQELAQQLSYHINIPLLHAAALLHDIDKNAEQLPGEKHPDACVRILINEHMPEVAAIVKTHPLHAILDPSICPTTWEEKLLFLADKMVKYEIITVDKRFDLWRKENLNKEAKQILKTSYPKVKALEKEIYGVAKRSK